MNLEDMLDNLNTNGATLANVEATSDITITKVPTEVETPVDTALESSGSVKDNILKKLARYDELVKASNKAADDYDAFLEKLKEATPDLGSELTRALHTQEACENEMEMIKKELLPMFQVAVVEDPDNKTLLCNKVQATYVYPTKKHSFDLKDFMEKESTFYFDNISKFAPYAKISDVSDSVKITIKK